jgi:hypothetical protein
MRKPRILAALAWYWIGTAVNRHEPLFLDRVVVDLFNRVLREARERFAIEVRHLAIEADRVSFCYPAGSSLTASPLPQSV